VILTKREEIMVVVTYIIALVAVVFLLFCIFTPSIEPRKLKPIMPPMPAQSVRDEDRSHYLLSSLPADDGYYNKISEDEDANTALKYAMSLANDAMSVVPNRLAGRGYVMIPILRGYERRAKVISQSRTGKTVLVKFDNQYGRRKYRRRPVEEVRY